MTSCANEASRKHRILGSKQFVLNETNETTLRLDLSPWPSEASRKQQKTSKLSLEFGIVRNRRASQIIELGTIILKSKYHGLSPIGHDSAQT